MFEHLKGKKLYRQPDTGLVFGVASGIATFFAVDVVFIRLGLVALAAIFGWSRLLLVYVIAFVLIPVDPTQDTVASTQEPKDVTPMDGGEKMDREHNM